VLKPEGRSWTIDRPATAARRKQMQTNKPQ